MSHDRMMSVRDSDCGTVLLSRDIEEARTKQLEHDKREEIAARLRQQIAQLSNPKSGTNKAAQFENLLVTYVRLLNETNNALEQLVARVQAGEGSRLTSTQDFIRKATEIRLLSDQFLTEVRILRDAAR